MNFFAYASAAAILASNLLYLRSIAKGQTRPSVAALLVFTLSLGSAFFSSAALGAGIPILAAIGTNATLCAATLAYALTSGNAHREFGRFEIGSLMAVAVGTLWWGLSGSAWAALVVPTLVDAAGTLLVIAKLRRDPGSEDVLAWALAWLAYVIGAIGLDAWELKNLIFAGSNIFLCAAVAFISHFGRRARTPIQPT